MGGLDDDERALFQSMILHFVQALNAERQKNAELQRRLEVAEDRLRFFDAAHYGIL
jgi:hypothetical protein